MFVIESTVTLEPPPSKAVSSPINSVNSASLNDEIVASLYLLPLALTL